MSNEYRTPNPRSRRHPNEVRKHFWQELAGGLTVTEAAHEAGVHHQTGRRWVIAANYVPVQKGPRRGATVPKEFWDQIRAGKSIPRAAVAVGVSSSAGYYWVHHFGQMPATTTAKPEREPVAGSPLTFTERWRIEELFATGKGCTAIGRAVGRSRSAIDDERARGKAQDGQYRAIIGQNQYEQNLKRPKPRKIDASPALADEIVDRLEHRHSPEQIAYRLRIDFPDDPRMSVSHETIYQVIYQSLYVQPRGTLARMVAQALRTGRIRRKHRGRQPQGLTRDNRIKNKVMISERPAEVDDRAVPGHWEGDLILGAHNLSAVGTLVERTTGTVLLLHLPGDHTAATVAAAMQAKIPELPAHLWRSLTWDQGIEMAQHAEITAATGLPIYFCEPHHPWQRGSNENTNGLLRQYLPKGTDLSFYGPGMLDNIAAELNSRPRKRLGWRTPAEKLDELLTNPSTGVATTT